MERKYRIIYNQDCTHIFSIVKEPIKPEHITEMIDEIVEGGAELILINPNAQKTNYPSRVWECFWEGENKDMAEDTSHVVRQMKHLAQQGYNYLKLALGRCREKHTACGVSIRMNDMHGALRPDTHPLNSSFYKQHPEYRLSGSVNLGWGKIGFNYEYLEVRLHYLKLIAEIVGGYDFDALELDFMRFPNYFPPGNYEKHCIIMTEFIRQVKEILDKKKVALYIRVASTPVAAYELGFDLTRLAKENIVEGVTFTEFLNTGWEMPVDEFREIMGKNVALYAGADVSADRRQGFPTRYMPHDELLLRGFAYGYLNAGADGLYFFNFFTPREKSGKDAEKPLRFDMFKKIKSIEMLRGCPKTYLLTANASPCCETDLPCQIPIDTGPRQSRRFYMLAGTEPDGCKFLLQVFFSGTISCDQLWLRWNLFPVGSARQIQDVAVKGLSGEKPIKQIQMAEFLVPSRAICNGRNHFILRNESLNEITIHGVELQVLPVKKRGNYEICH